MAGSIVIFQLVKRYATLLGEHNAAEREAEDAVGLEAIEAAHLRIANRQRDLKAQMAEIAGAIRQFDPKFNIASIRPKRPKKQIHKYGSIARKIYSVLRQENRPLRTREISRLVAPLLDVPIPDEAAMANLDAAVFNDLTPRIGKTIMVEGEPKRWSIIPGDKALATRTKAVP